MSTAPVLYPLSKAPQPSSKRPSPFTFKKRFVKQLNQYLTPLLPLGRLCVPPRHRRVQHPVSGGGGNGRLDAVPHPQPVPAQHLALPGAARGHAGAERGADPRGGVGGRPHPGGDPRPYRLR